MTPERTTDHARIAALIDAAVAADPVRATVLGSVGQTLTDGAWAAWDGESVAARSSADTPIALHGPWPDAAGLAEALTGLEALGRIGGGVDVVDRLVAALGRPVEQRRAERLYRCERLTAPPVPGRALVAGEEHRALVRGWFADFAATTLPDGVDRRAVADRALDEGGVRLWDDGGPVALAARRRVVGGSARLGPVYTPAQHRGRGYGSAVTAAATASVLADGAVPVLFTDLANPTSNHIYQALGYTPVEDRLSVVVGRPGSDTAGL